MTARLAEHATRTGSTIRGIGAYRPDRVVTNDEFAARLDTDDEWIRQRTGIVERRFAAEDETVIDMAVRAGAAALADAGLAPGDVDAVVVPTCTLTAAIPNAAARVAQRLGIDAAGTFDLNAGCAGFCYGLAVASDFVRGGSARNVLVAASEKLTDVVDQNDRRTAVIFADGAGAAVVGASDTIGIGPVSWGHLGERSDILVMRDGFVQQDGVPLFRWATRQVPETALAAVRLAGLEPRDVDVVVTHQANLRIIKEAERSLLAAGFRADVVVADDIRFSGNTSAASIPLALDAMRRDGRVHGGDVVVAAAVGAGLTFAGQVIVLPESGAPGVE